MPPARERCAWAKDDLLAHYHDTEWGVPVRDDARLFEFLSLGGAQAGLSWRTILARREGYRRTFEGFDPARVAQFGEPQIERLVADASIVRNRAKIKSVVVNARQLAGVQTEFGSFADFAWSFTGGRTLHNRWATEKEIPATSDLSDAMSRELRKRGFTFVGSTICYAFMQAVGIVNDHTTDCPRHAALSEKAK